jgi:hypothetical protein
MSDTLTNIDSEFVRIANTRAADMVAAFSAEEK